MLTGHPNISHSNWNSLCKVGLRRSMKRFLTFLVLGALLGAGACLTGWAQGATAQISGTVKDQSSAVLPGAEITATQTETGAARMAVSDETGSYVLPNLPV